MPKNQTGLSSKTWVSQSRAAEILDVPVHVIDELVSEGRLSRRDLPTRKRYDLAEVEALARSCVKKQ